MTCQDSHSDLCKHCETNIKYPEGLHTKRYRKFTLECGHRVTTNQAHISCVQS